MKRKSAMPFYGIAVLGLLAAIGGCSGAPAPAAAPAPVVQGVPLDQAIEAAAQNIEGKLEKGIKIATLNFSSASGGLSEYVLEELSMYLVNGGKLLVVDRSDLDSIRTELNFNLSGEVDDRAAQEMGRMLGAQYIVSGSLLDLGDVSRIRFKTIAVESAGIAASTSVDITNDTKVKRLLAIGGSTQQASAQQASAQGRSRAQGGNTASGGAVGANSGGSSGTASAGTVSSAAASTPAAPTIQSAPTVSSMPVPVVTPSAVSVAEMPLTIGPSNPENYRVLKTIQVGKPVWAVTYSPDGSRIAGTDGKLIKTYTAQTGNVWKTFDYSSSYNTVSSIDFSPDGKYLVTGGEKLRIWNVESGAYRDFDTYSGVRDVSYSPDGKHIAYSHLSSGTSTLYVCNANNGQKIWEKRERSLPTWGPDGKKLASDGEYILDILDSATGEMIKNSSGTGGRSGYLTWHSDGRQIAMGDRYLINISIFDIETSKVVWKLTGHKDRVKAIAFSPDCRRLISGSSDKTIKVWDVESGWEIKTMTNHTNYVNSVAYSPDGKHFVSGSEDGTIIIWGE